MKTIIHELLMEAKDRLEKGDMQQKSLPILRRWVGLGTAATYKPMIEAGLMQFDGHRTPPNRCVGWLCLTPKGLEELQKL